MATRSVPSDWDPLGGTTAADVLEQYKGLRETCPVAYSDRFGGFWALAKYNDVVEATRNTETFSSARGPIWTAHLRKRPLQPPLHADRPDHTEYRRILSPYFTPRFVKTRTDAIRTIARTLLDPMIQSGHADFFASFANPYPALVLCMFTDLDPASGPLIKVWTEEILRANRENDLAGLDAAEVAFASYITEVVEGRRAHPRNIDTDLISGLLVAELHGDKLSNQTIVSIIRLLLAAGHSTTTHALGSAALYLATHRLDQDRLRADSSLIPAAVEEFLRCWAPNQALPRRLTRDVDLGGRHLASDEGVALLWSSANRDAEIFPEADRCIIDRTPNPHIAFGSGIHRCLGAHLAQVELRVGLEELLSATTGFDLAGVESYSGWPSLGPTNLPLNCTPGNTPSTRHRHG